MSKEEKKEGLYKKLLGMGKEAIDAVKLPFKVRGEKKKLEMKIIEIEEQIAKDDLTIQEQQSAHPVDWDKLIDAKDKKALNERKLKQLEELETEMFGEE